MKNLEFLDTAETALVMSVLRNPLADGLNIIDAISRNTETEIKWKLAWLRKIIPAFVAVMSNTTGVAGHDKLDVAQLHLKLERILSVKTGQERLRRHKIGFVIFIALAFVAKMYEYLSRYLGH